MKHKNKIILVSLLTLGSALSFTSCHDEGKDIDLSFYYDNYSEMASHILKSNNKDVAVFPILLNYKTIYKIDCLTKDFNNPYEYMVDNKMDEHASSSTYYCICNDINSDNKITVKYNNIFDIKDTLDLNWTSHASTRLIINDSSYIPDNNNDDDDITINTTVYKLHQKSNSDKELPLITVEFDTDVKSKERNHFLDYCLSNIQNIYDKEAK